jgi:TRAP-type C4-dicarboxylate transport system substrate-binding protein
MTPKKLRWLIAHQPAYLFVRTAEAFAKELDKTCPGQFEIEILTMKQYIEKYGDIPEMKLKPAAVRGIEEGVGGADRGVFTPAEWSEVKTKWKAVFDGMRQEKFHLSQTQVTVIGGHLSDQFAVLDLPFLFDSHDHVSTVLDGEIGDRLCEDMGKKTKIKGLGFTYSGGYRVVGSNHIIGDLGDLKDVNITTTPMTKNFFGKFAASAESRLNQKIEEIAQSASNGGAVETTYLRFSGKNILKTNHSMFLTTILVGGEFFETLTSEQQDAFRKAAKVVAKLERQWSLDDAEKYEQEAAAKGIEIREITESEKNKLRAAAPDQYGFAYSMIPGSESLVNEIKKTK